MHFFYKIVQFRQSLSSNGNVPDEVYNDAIKQFTEEELIELTLAVTTINTYNRINIAFKVPGGSYKVGQFAVQA